MTNPSYLRPDGDDNIHVIHQIDKNRYKKQPVIFLSGRSIGVNRREQVVLFNKIMYQKAKKASEN